MADVSSLNVLVQNGRAKVQNLEQQKTTKEGELTGLESTSSTAQATLESNQNALSETNTALSNFQVPDVIDEPDRSSFVSVDEETGKEVFDSSGYDAANRAYEESVRAHEEALRQKAELEAKQLTQSQAVDSSQSECTNLQQGIQTTTGEIQTISDDINVSMNDIQNWETEISQAESVKQPEVVADDSESEPDVVTTDVPVQNNKGWEYYARLELEAEHEGEEGYKPSPADLHARAGEIKQRNIDNGNVGQKGDLRVGTPQNPKYVTLNGEIDTSELQSTEEALGKYVEGQEILAEEARLKAEAEAAAKEKEALIEQGKKADEEAAAKEREALIEQGKKDAEKALKDELSNLSEAEVKKILEAKDMSDDQIDKAIGEVMGNLSKAISITDVSGQDIGKLTGRLAKQYGAKNAQKILGRICNTAAKSAGKAVPFANAAMAGYGIYKVQNGDMSGWFDIADVAISYVPVLGTAYSLIGTENIYNFLNKGSMACIKGMEDGSLRGLGFMGGHCMR